jgi:hypothetical protein
MSDEKHLPPAPEPAPPPPAAMTAPGHPPPGQMDLEAARYWAGRGPAGQLRRHRFPYSIMGMGD